MVVIDNNFFIGVQCEEDFFFIENRYFKKEVRRFQEELWKYKWGVECIRDDDVMICFYIGLFFFVIFLWLYK